MIRKLIALPVAMAFAIGAWAAMPVAHVFSTQPFDLNGVAVPIAGVPSWPVFDGDVIAAHAAPATIVFRDGTRVLLAEDSTIKIEAKKSKNPAATVLNGSAKYLVAGGAIAVPAAAAAFMGSNATGYPKPSNPSPSH